jgi:hypothetical protein
VLCADRGYLARSRRHFAGGSLQSALVTDVAFKEHALRLSGNMADGATSMPALASLFRNYCSVRSLWLWVAFFRAVADDSTLVGRRCSVVKKANSSPQIRHVSWGRLELEGQAEPYKDAKLFPGGSCEWNWRETGTSHRPGIQVADVQELVDRGAKVVVLSRGMAECLHVPRETLEFLKQRQIAVHVLPTQHAVALYNKLAQTEPVGGLFHTTC